MDEQLAGLYRQVVYEELIANEGRLTVDNGLDFSVDTLEEKISVKALPALMQKALLLCSLDSDVTQNALILDDTLDMIQHLASSDKAKGEVSIIDELRNMASEDARQNFHVLNNYYEHLLCQTDGERLSTGKENAKLDPSREQDKIEHVKDRREFVTAGQMLGRPPPSNRTEQVGVTNVIRKPVGLSKRVKTDQAKPMAMDTIEETMKTVDVDPRLKGIDPKLVETIQNEIIHRVDTVTWDQIAGLDHAKNTIKEIVIWPMLRPDIFIGLRGPPKGLLLFGPPGTGKTMIGKCIASQSQATFFSISASSLTSKWVGEGEKLVRALFACARALQPSVIFIDEIDSLLTQRTDGEFEASRRIKTEFLVQFDGAATSSDDRILVIGATNRPQELDEAARRRLVKRLYIPLPDSVARKIIVEVLLKSQRHSLTTDDIEIICQKTEGYSGADVDNLCREAALGPIRSIDNILEISAEQVRPIDMSDFSKAMSQVRASVSSTDLNLYLDWNTKFGSLALNSLHT